MTYPARVLGPVSRPYRSLALALAGVGLVALGGAAFASTRPPREHVVAWLVLVAGSVPVLVGAGVLLARARLSERGFRAAALAGALLLRLGALAAPVSLSDDVHRYVWDGILVADGLDPFAHRPMELARHPELGDEALSRLNSPRYYSVYPPLAQASFAAAVGLERLSGVDAALALRALYTLAELFAFAALLVLGARLEVGRGWALAYGWHPLAFWEVAAGGHTEALMMPLLVLALAATLDERPARAGFALGLATSAKLTALVALPVLVAALAHRLGWRRALAVPLLATLVPAALFLPFASAHLLPHLGESLNLYHETFSFNAPVYYGLRGLLGYREGVTASVDGVVGPLLTSATLSWLAWLAYRQDGSPRRLALGLAYALVGHLLLSRVMHPWYLLPPLAVGALARSRAIAALGLLALTSYLRYGPLDREAPTVLAVQLAAFAALALPELRPPRSR